MKVEFDEKCKVCKGTGLYQGMAERPPYAVVCHNCKGTGKFHFIHEYEEFEKRELRENVDTVLRCNPGIMVGGHEHNFGGITYDAWLNEEQFKPGTEMRDFTCPAWWYQSADYDKKPQWKECGWGGAFSHCQHFGNKTKCWERWDRENQCNN